MTIRSNQRKEWLGLGAVRRAFTLVEVLISVVLLAMVLATICYGYTEANRIAIWCSMSQAGQSFAMQGMEQARAALWNPWDAYTNTGYRTEDELPPSAYAVFTQQDFMDIPMKGAPFTSTSTNFTYFQTNYVYITQISNSTSGRYSAPLRQIKSTVVWTFPFTGQCWTNTVVTLRASDQ
ncbi:MAG TPA: prepilin-type N-terminal cleavage/methylation domain-containing protein [Verrucomicrobiae bacterium]|jgi:prepilin-type N-terminal cleavage/methylation domain-containing protein